MGRKHTIAVKNTSSTVDAGVFTSQFIIFFKVCISINFSGVRILLAIFSEEYYRKKK